MLIAFRVMLLVFLAIAFFGCIGGNENDKRNCRLVFGVAGVLFVLSYLP